MNFNSAMKAFSFFVALMLFAASVTSAPTYSAENDNSIRELIEMLLQREKENSLEDSRVGYHTVSRKAGRSPQLRLRFGKRMDSQYSVPAAYITGLNDITTDN